MPVKRSIRFYLALHAFVPLALAASMALHLAPTPAHWAALAQRPVWTVWALIGFWLVVSALAAALQPVALWRMALWAAGAMLLALGLAALPLGAALGGSMLGGLLACAFGCVAMGLAIAPARVQVKVPRPVQRAPRAAPPAQALTAETAAHRPLWHRIAPLHHLAQWMRWPHWPFVVVAALGIESFRLAHVVGSGIARPSGMAGLLVAFFLALPAATLRHWWGRWAAALWLLAGVAYIGLAFKSGLPQWPVAAALCLWQPAWALRQRLRLRATQAKAEHQTASTGTPARSTPQSAA
ncbi:hypothetical protein [Acidovorax sp. DW039]|uniref:hypothetical protein n=1 Tax=Acidovorax sp. DW039 TaxID=3095606 RepID=UPI0030D18C47